MTPMIDIVFQMIIFFVLTIQMDKQSTLETINLALSPHGPTVEQKDPRTVTFDVDKDGQIYLARVPLSFSRFQKIMTKTRQQYGQSVPVVIRGDGKTEHRHIRKAMDACKAAGFWKVKFSAIKDKV